MGLDGVELVMEMEETFGIVFDDREAASIVTVGQAYRAILRKLEGKHAAPCPSAALFYRLRAGLMAISGADRREIRPASPVAALVPANGFRSSWDALGEGLGVRLPALELAPWQSRLALGLGLATGAIVLAAGSILEGGIGPDNLAPALGVTAFSASLGWVAAYRAFAPFASTVPRGCETLRGLVRATLGRYRLHSDGNATAWHPEEVWATLRELISEQLGVPRDMVAEEKSFVDDFGMD